MKMGEKNVVIHVCTDPTPITLPIQSDLTAEDACIQICRRINIGPVARHLFALKFRNVNVWLCPNFLLAEADSSEEFDFRCRFKVSSLYVLSKVDDGAFEYYFHQVRSDVMLNQIADISYDKSRDEVMGLSVVDMYRVMVEKGVEMSTVESDYKKFIPKEVMRHHSRFIKRPIHNSLVKITNGGNHNPTYVKHEYLKQFEKMAPNYLFENFKAVTDYGGTFCHIDIKVNPYHTEMPGIQFSTNSQREWQHLCTIENLCYLSARNDGTVEISRKNGIPLYLKFKENLTMYSFISLLDGYYRMMVKWTFNLCKDVVSPSLQALHKLKCHGPVGGVFSYSKLESKRENKPGCFILRECETNYDIYFVDVCTHERLKPSTYKITKLKEGEFIFEADSKKYSSIVDVINTCRKGHGPLLLEECLPPSEYDKPPQLICQPDVSVENEVVNGAGKIDGFGSGSPVLIDTKNFRVYGQKTLKSGSMCMVYRGDWRTPNGKKVEVALKTLKHPRRDSHLRKFLDLANKWSFLQSHSIVKLYGITLGNPVIMVMEYFKLGPLDAYLRENKHQMKPVDLVEAATYLATALWHLEEKCVVHGNIRCRKVMVCAHDESHFKVQLSDPGLHQYSAHDVYWIPVECYANPACAQDSFAADVWALGTTLWEIFSLGDKLPKPTNLETIHKEFLRGKKLPIPNNCPREVYNLMLECWDLDFHSRKKPQAVMRDINQILYQVFNSRQTHSYATAFPKNFERLEVDPETSTASSSILSGETAWTSLNSGEGEGNPILSNITDHPFGTNMFQDLSSGFSADCSLIGISLLKDRDDLSQSSSGFSPNLSNFRFPSENTSLDSVTSMQGIFELSGECNLVLQGRIGQGFYGEVYRGHLEREKDCEIELVAVKQLKTNALGSCLQDFEREISIMKTLKHPNIVEIKGVLEESGLDEGGRVRLVMEYVQHGSLLCYLKINKEKLSDHSLFKFALDVAEGMEYLGAKKIVHRDLAARNILVASDSHVKISDFGLAQVMGENNYYILKTNRELPIKWYAPESLRDGKFSTSSDVWSYGVTLFEMFSRGEDPRLRAPSSLAHESEKILNKQLPNGPPQDERQEQEILLQALESGTRLPCPAPCAPHIYAKLITPCWKFLSHERPSFTQLCRTVEDLMDS